MNQDTRPIESIKNCLAPAKLNLFLHVVGRRSDGYHNLQTVFQLVDWADRLSFIKRADGQIIRGDNKIALDFHATSDLSIRAATLLKQYSGCADGVTIFLEKNIPIGGGLGGGSSDAATTLIALNRLWQLNLSRLTLVKLALQLGADVPFFIFGQNAFAEGVGEQLQAISLPKRFFVIVTPPIQVSTPSIFSAEHLTRDTNPIKIADFLQANDFDQFGQNDLQKTVTKCYPAVDEALNWMSSYANTRLTGSGSSLFSAFKSFNEAKEFAVKIPQHWAKRVVESLHTHPMQIF